MELDIGDSLGNVRDFDYDFEKLHQKLKTSTPASKAVSAMTVIRAIPAR